MKTLIHHSSNCEAFFTSSDCLVCVIITLTTTCWQATQMQQHKSPSLALLCSATHCNVNSGALQSDWANGVPSRQVMRPTRTCREIVHIKPVGKFANTRAALKLC